MVKQWNLENEIRKKDIELNEKAYCKQKNSRKLKDKKV